MAALTLAQSEALGTAWVKVLKDLRAALDGTYLTDIDAVATTPAGNVGDFGYTLQGVAQDHRANAAVLLGRQWAQAGLAPTWREFGRVAAAAETVGEDFTSLLRRVFDYRADNSKLVTSRQITYDTPAAGGSNSGNGTLTRLTVDERGYNLENCYVELKTCECISDAQMGRLKYGELFEFRGSTASKDQIALAGSGLPLKRRYVAKHAGAGDGGSLLQNASFESYSTGATHPFTGWTADTEANIAQDLTAYYRGYPGAPDALASLRFNGNAVVSQALSVTNQPLLRYQPYGLSIAVNREIGSGDGTLRIRMGAHTTTVVLAAQTGWNRLTVPFTSSCWLRNFDEQSLDVTVELSGRSTGYVLVDDFCFAPIDYFDGSFWWLMGGATAFLLRDKFTMTDTGGAATTGLIRYWLWRSGLLDSFPYFPVGTGGAVTWADP